MDFAENIPIYLQIRDYCHAEIVDGRWAVGERIPSTKDLAMQLAVNNRTVMRAYDELAAEGVVTQRRGMGYYVAADAAGLILSARRREFLEVTVPQLARTMAQLGLTLDDIAPLLGGR